MKDYGLVSVVIPTYNRSRTVGRAIQSVLEQTYANTEVIVVDDCSSDDTEAVVRSIGDPRVKYYRQAENAGACAARNKGVELSAGEIIAFQDSDDRWHSDKLIKQLEFASSGGFDMVSCGYNRRYLGSDSVSVGGLFNCPDGRDDLWCSVINSHWISTQTIVCRSYCFEKAAFDPEVTRFQDWDFALQIAAAGYRIGVLNEALVDVYVQEDSITGRAAGTENKLRIIEKHRKDVDFGNKKMAAQYYKSLADAQRRKYRLSAGRNYLRSFGRQQSPKILLLGLLCFSGLMGLYRPRKAKGIPEG